VSDAVPAWAYEKTRICPPDPGRAAQAAVEIDRLTAALRPWLVDGVEHVGSTSVPGLAAKPVIDLMASVEDLDRTVAGAGDQLAAHGWCYVPPGLDLWPWRRFFVLPDASGAHRRAHLHLLPVGHPRWAEQLAFRDALRADATLVARYAQIKRRLAEQHGADREAYTQAKTDFVREVLAGIATG
jgi:GrpB-like predicted nucleotidyltransferase (UPF0157 family)